MKFQLSLGLATLAFLVGTNSFAEGQQPELLPIPEPTLAPELQTVPQRVAPITPVAPGAPIVPAAPALQSILKPVPEPVAKTVACKTAKVADVYTVLELNDQCGNRLKDNGLLGIRNRRNACATESVLAKVFAAPCTCEDCHAVRKVAQIRCDRGECQCYNDDYIKALIFDLSSYSRKVRKVAERTLKGCKLRVVDDRACVTEEVPSVVLY
jgi:hypothetical protein